MSIIKITVEGPSDQKFFKDILGAIFVRTSRSLVHATPVTTNAKKRVKGGAVNWDKFYYHLSKWMAGTAGQYHTTMYDLYALDTSWPGYNHTLRGREKAMAIQEGMKQTVNARNLIPYMQVHEFEFSFLH